MIGEEMRLRKASTKAMLAALLTLGLVTVAAQPAMAIGYVSPCTTTNLYSNQWAYATGPTGTTFADKVVWCQMQAGPAHAWYNVQAPQGGGFVYDYLANGIPGPNTWKGLQSYLSVDWGYRGPINGIPGPNTYNAIIRAGNSTGQYGTQPQDGSLSAVDWRSFAYLVKANFFGV
jgi:hypothetical protein